MSQKLNPEKALIFRIEHVDNLPWDLEKDALNCRNSGEVNPDYVNIGNTELIDLRSLIPYPLPPAEL